MTFYQELQLSSTGSKQLIKNTTDPKEKQDTIAYQGSSSKYGKYKLRMRLFIVDRNKSSAYELTM